MVERLAAFRQFLAHKGRGQDWSDEQLGRALRLAQQAAAKRQGSDQAPGLMMIPETTFLRVWHDEDVLSNKYESFGIIVGPAPGGRAGSFGSLMTTTLRAGNEPAAGAGISKDKRRDRRGHEYCVGPHGRVPCGAGEGAGAATATAKPKPAAARPAAKPIAHGQDHPGAAPKSKVSVKETKVRAISDDLTPVPIKTKLSKQETGRVGEAVVLAWLQSQKATKDAVLNNTSSGKAGTSQSIEMLADSMAPEITAGLCSNGRDAQKWRITFSMNMSKEQQAAYAAASPEQKAEFNARMQQACYEGKMARLVELERETGKTIKPVTVTTVLNPDTRTADIYVTDGYHPVLRWKDAKRVASVEYDSAE